MRARGHASGECTGTRDLGRTYTESLAEKEDIGRHTETRTETEHEIHPPDMSYVHTHIAETWPWVPLINDGHPVMKTPLGAYFSSAKTDLQQPCTCLHAHITRASGISVA